MTEGKYIERHILLSEILWECEWLSKLVEVYDTDLVQCCGHAHVF